MLWKAVLKLLKGKHQDTAKNGAGEVVSRDSPTFPRKNRGERIQLVVGLDFGTSFSKVVVGEARVRRAVPFEEHAFGENKFLLPSALCILPEMGKCELGAKEKAGRLYDNLKMPLIERNFSDEVQSRAAAFLALVFRHTRHWFFDKHGSTYEYRKIEWFVNVGLPTDSYEDEELTSAYLRIVRSAWRTSMMPGDITLQAARDSLERDDTSGEGAQEGIVGPLLPDDRIHAFPEFVAQLAGYVRSSRRRDGLHVTVDIGGGTLDVTVFNVHQNNDGEDIYPIFARKVAPLGVRYLFNARSRGQHEKISETLSPFEDLPSDADFRKMFQITKDELRQVDQQFRKEVESVVSKPILHTKQHRNPLARQWCRGSDGYGEPLPSFFCGGGAMSDFYADLLKKFERKDPPFKLRPSPLPPPNELEPHEMIERDYARLAVAYGLSLDPYDIGRVKRMNEIENVHAETSNSTYEEERYITKEQM